MNPYEVKAREALLKAEGGRNHYDNEIRCVAEAIQQVVRAEVSRLLSEKKAILVALQKMWDIFDVDGEENDKIPGWEDRAEKACVEARNLITRLKETEGE